LNGNFIVFSFLVLTYIFAVKSSFKRENIDKIKLLKAILNFRLAYYGHVEKSIVAPTCRYNL